MEIIYDSNKLKHYIELRKLNDFMITDISKISNILSFKKNEYIINNKTSSNYLMFLVKGEIIISSISSNGKDTCIKYYKDKALIGEAASLWNLNPNKNVKAISNCLFIAIDLDKHRDLLLNDIQFLKNISKILALKINDDSNLLLSISNSLEIRLADFILSNSKENHFDFKLSLCAQILNTSYRHLLRVINKFIDLGILEKDKKKFLILDKNKLIKIKLGQLSI